MLIHSSFDSQADEGVALDDNDEFKGNAGHGSEVCASVCVCVCVEGEGGTKACLIIESLNNHGIADPSTAVTVTVGQCVCARAISKTASLAPCGTSFLLCRC